MKITALRGGAATLFYPIWHKEVESLLVLKNNRGVEDNRARHLDYGVQLSKLFYMRFIKKGNITLFSPSDVPGLYEAFFRDQDEFEKLYVQYENDESIRKHTVAATDLFASLMQERASTGRIYIHNVDHTNTNSAFDSSVAPIYQSNLCCFTGDTKIMMDGKLITIKEAANIPMTQEQRFFTHTSNYTDEGWQILAERKAHAWSNGIKAVIKITLENGDSFKCTPDHKLAMLDGTWIEAKDSIGTTLHSYRWIEVNPDESLLDDTGYWELGNTVVSIEDAGEEEVFDMEVDETHCFYIFGTKSKMLVHNCEITLPTSPVTLDGEGEIALCTLAGVNLGAIENVDEMEELMDLLVRSLDELLDYQDYPVVQAEHAKNRRALGIGVINFAYYLAKNRTKYSAEAARKITHDAFEALQFYGLKASMELAKEKGKCGYFDQTSYSKGILPIDRYKKEVDEVIAPEYRLDWEWLRAEIAKHGLRNSTITSQFPSETSSQVSNATNGIEPPRGLVSVKQSKDGILKQVVPEINKYRYEYETLWEFPDNTGYINLVAIMQKFIDQSISSNTNYDPSKFSGGKVPLSVMLKDLLTCYKLGVKTLYYHNTRDGADDTQGDIDDGCAGGACKL